MLFGQMLGNPPWSLRGSCREQMSSTGPFCVVGFTSQLRDMVLDFLSSHIARRQNVRSSVLRGGALPLEVLNEQVDTWIKTRR